MMTWPRGPTPTTDGFSWREARCLARVAQTLVTSPNDEAAFKRELEDLMGAAAALCAGGPPSRVSDSNGADHSDRTDSETEGEVLALWRTNPSAVHAAREEARDEAAPPDTPVSCDATDIHKAELVRAINEIERAAAALRADEASCTVPAVVGLAADRGALDLHRGDDGRNGGRTADFHAVNGGRR